MDPLIGSGFFADPGSVCPGGGIIPVRSPECEGVAMRDFGGQARARHRKVPWIVGSVLLALGTQYRKGTGRANHCASDWRLKTFNSGTQKGFEAAELTHNPMPWLFRPCPAVNL